MKKQWPLIILLIISPSAFAKWSGQGTIESVYSHNGYHIIHTTISDNTCGSAGKFYWPTSDDDAKDMLSIALTAFTTSKRVSVVYNETTPDCKWGGEKSTHLAIFK